VAKSRTPSFELSQSLPRRCVQPGVEPAAPDTEASARAAVGTFQVEPRKLRVARSRYCHIDTLALRIGPIALVPIIPSQVVPFRHAGGNDAFKCGKLQGVTGSQSNVSWIVSPLIFIDGIALPNAITGGDGIAVYRLK